MRENSHLELNPRLHRPRRIRNSLLVVVFMVSAGAVSMAQSLIPQNGWSVVYVDSPESICGNGVASNAIDDNSSTMWHTQFCPTTAALPHEIQIDLGAYYSLSAFQYLPRQDGSACGWINQYEFYVSTDGVNWGTPVAAGNFDYTGYTAKCPGPGAGIPTPRQIGFPATLGRFICLRALSEITGKPYTSAAEINVVGTASVLPPVTVSQLILNPTTVLAGSASSATVTLTAPALSGGAVVTLSSSNPAVAAVPASLSFPPGVSSGEFLISASLVSTSTSANILASYGGVTQSATITVIPGTLIPQNGWAVVYVDSQETICGSGAASNAIDGNSSTMWHTQFCPTTAALPHEIQIDLGAYYSLSAFQYLPRQDGSACGWINQYEFYVSTDGVNWGTPVAAGNFDYTGYTAKCPGPGAGIPTPRQIGFPATLGRFIRLRALSEITGKPYTSAAEINVVGTASVLPPVTVSQLILNPTTVLAGSASSATVTLTAPALSGGAVVTLSSSNPAVAAVPASLSFPPGVSSGEFLISASLVSTSTSANILASYGGVTQSATITVIPGTLIPQNGWAVVYVDSQETICGSGAASNAIDGNSSTMWHTQFCPTTAALPHEIQIDLGAYYSLSAFQYLPRQDGSACGWINQYEFYVSTDGVNWGTPVAAGNFDYTGYTAKCPGPGAGIPTPRQIGFPATLGRFIRLRALSEITGKPYTSAAEINVVGTASVLPPVTVSQLILNPTTVLAGSASSATVTLTAPALSGGAVVTLSSSNPAVAAVPASLSFPPGVSSGEFLISASLVSTSTSANILASYGGVTQSATITVIPGTLIPQNGWAVVYADSQETICGNGAASNAIDGNSSTMWHTQFCPTTAALPHEIQIDLGASYTLSAFQYLPRQDGSACGWIKQYEFYVSPDGINWGTPVAAGTFDYTGYAIHCPGPGAGAPTPRQIGFPAAIGRYIRLRALSEMNGNPWTSAAEINVLSIQLAPLALAVNPTSVPGGSVSTGTVTLAAPA